MKTKLKTIINDNKNLSQINKLLLTSIFCILLLLGTDLILSIPQVHYYFGSEFLSQQSGIWFWIILWLVMFAQVTIIPIPAMPIYVVCNNIPNVVANDSSILGLFSGQTIFFCTYVTSACVAGCIAAYAMGRFGGKKIVKWMAGDEEEFDKWCHILNGKKGKIFYGLTVFLPIFPDDLLSIVVGSLKIDFKYYVIINIIGKWVGDFFINLFIRLPYVRDFFIVDSTDGFPWLKVILYCTLILICLILMLCSKYKLKNLKEKDPV